jgi:hypothetical protein
MAYPTVSAPYGFRPVNLIGGQVFSGSTRNFPIAYGFTNSIYYGDFVTLSNGYIIPSANAGAIGTGASAVVGVFLGCYYTNPITKQRLWSQSYQGGTTPITAGDITAIVADDPDTVFKAAVVTGASATTIGSASSILVGQNMAGNSLTSLTTSNATGNGAGAVVNASSSTGNFRVIGLVPDTQIQTSASYISGTTTMAVGGLVVGQYIPVGTDVFQQINGQLQFTGSTVTTGVTVTSSSSQNLSVTAQTTAGSGFPAVTLSTSNPLVLVQTPEVLVKVTAGASTSAHRYYVN